MEERLQQCRTVKGTNVLLFHQNYSVKGGNISQNCRKWKAYSGRNKNVEQHEPVPSSLSDVKQIRERSRLFLICDAYLTLPSSDSLGHITHSNS